MKKWIALAVLAVILLYFPSVLAALIGAVGTIAVAAAAQPACWAFTAGLLAAPRLARAAQRWTP